MRNRTWFIVCICIGLAAFWLPNQIRGVALLFIGMAAGRFLAKWDDES